MLKSEEFAKQIHFLNDTAMDRAMAKSKKSGHEFAEERNVPHPMYVSQWLMAVSSSRFTEVNDDCPVISKKMRDEVILGKEKLPFRRSGFYTAMKVFLQLGLTIALEKECGKFVYKLVMLKFMSRLCDEQAVEADVAIQMLAKIARRMEKIRYFAGFADMPENELNVLKDTVVTEAVKTVRVVREELDKKFGVIQKNELRTSTLEAMPRLAFEQDIRHQIPKLLAHIEMLNTGTVSGPIDNYPKPRRISRHAWQNKSFPDVNLMSQVSGEIDVLQLLADFEHWIFVSLEENHRNHTASSLRQLATTYMSKALSFYQNDCFGYSKMVLAMLQIIKVCRIIK